ncbi:hypothetical protein [Tepidibacter mesophilus]|uniref:hypothetical protein n=1 Tax=Tepidibacter mesophilus TaxID=655607 RepID=UPI000C073817|nr:hypothetical protein [Tepidibacter mesophilus]
MKNKKLYPEDKLTKYYLLNNYFHDSDIENIEFSNSKGKDSSWSPDQVKLNISSIIDVDNIWDKLKGTDDEKRSYVLEHKEKFEYILYFQDCKYFNYEKSICANDYIYGEFLDSVILKKINKSTGKQYYHFRIRTDDGYMDIVYSKFKIRKKIGRIRVRDTQIVDYNIKTLINEYEHIVKADGTIDTNALIGIVKTANDYDRYKALYYLYKYTDIIIVDYARNIMKLDREENEDSRTIAIDIIGKQGDEMDIPILFDEYFSLEKNYTKSSICYCSTLYAKRKIMDAIENIKYRQDASYTIIL